LDSIAHYKILERVGESRLGEVFRARDTRLGRTVAIKIPPEAIQKDTAKRAALLVDARTAMALSHPNIATLYEVGDDNGRVFLACEFVPGDSLDLVIAGHPLNAARDRHHAQVADALADAHSVDFAHGDLTKDSIVVTPKGAAKTLDFGWPGGRVPTARQAIRQAICARSGVSSSKC
jgi:serine/threonine protein kinase